MQVQEYLLCLQLCSKPSSKFFVVNQEMQLYVAKIYLCPQQFRQEINVYASEIKNKHILQMIEACEEGEMVADDTVLNHPMGVFEFFEKGNLLDLVMISGGAPENIAKKLFKGIIQGLKQLHQKNFSHNRLSLQIMVLDRNFIIKLSSFEYASPIIDSDGKVHLLEKRFIENKKYWSLEIAKAKTYQGVKSDIFAAGLMLFQILTARFPPQKMNNVHEKVLKSGNNKTSQTFWKRFEKSAKRNQPFSNPLKKLLESLLSLDPQNRWSIDQILNCQWLVQDPVSTDDQYIQFLSSAHQKLLSKSKPESTIRKVQQIVERFQQSPQ